MKKRNMSLALLALIAGISLTSCDSEPIKPNKDGAILTINSGTDSTKSIDVDSIFERSLLTSSGITAYYNAICEVLVRGTIPETEEITKKAERRVDDIKYQAKSNAETNSTKYDEELDKLLSDNGVEDLKELKDKFTYDILKEKAYDQFFDDKSEDLLSEYINKMVPYHVRHILVKISGSSDDGSYKASITKQEALNLVSVINRLAKGNSFGTVAREQSEDEGSAKAYGDLGLMTTATSYVPEFKLGLYAYDSLVNKTATVEQGRKENLNMSASAKEYYKDDKLIGTINYSDILKIGEVAEKEKDVNGNPVNSGNVNYYPRNIYFNNYMNKHTMNLIVNDGNTNLPGFKKVSEIPELNGVTGLDANTYVLVTEKSQPILAVRAGTGSGDSGYQGIHFIIAEKSPLVVEDLNDYYSYKKSVGDYNDLIGQTFVSFTQNSNSEYKKRMETIENEVKNFDKMIDAKIYEEFIDDVNENGERKFEINNDIKVTLGDKELTLEDAITTYIANNRAYFAAENNVKMNREWNEFIEKLEVYDANRANDKKLIDITCATAFDQGNAHEEYKEGGKCYVAK